MTPKETAQMLAVLKANHPASFRNMTAQEAEVTVKAWARQFAKYPYAVVMIAVDKLGSTNTFAPSVGEIKDKIKSLYWEAWEMLQQHKRGLQPLDDRTLAAAEEIVKFVEPMRNTQTNEPALSELLGGYAQYLTESTGTFLKE